MKKIYIITLLFVFVTTVGYSQSEIDRKKSYTKNKVERLNFTYNDFLEEQKENLPWQDFNTLLEGLKNIKNLIFKQSRLINGTNSFRYNTLLSKVKVNLENRSISLANCSITQNDTLQYSESYKGHLYNSDNNFFPKEELSPFRIVKTENITVPAGTFNCKVIEGFDGKTKLKYWMVINKPGVYAKIIREGVNPFGKLEYSIVELEEIK